MCGFPTLFWTSEHIFLCTVPTLVWTFEHIFMCGDPTLLLHLVPSWMLGQPVCQPFPSYLFLQIFCSVPTLVWTSDKIILIWIFSVPSSSQTFYNFVWCPHPSLNYWPNILNWIVHCTPSPLPTLKSWDDSLVLNLCPLLSGMCAPPP